MNTKDKQDTLTIYVVRERKSKSSFATIVPRKGIHETTVAVDFMLDCIAELGFANHKIYLKNDQEPAIQSVIQGVVQGRAAPTLLEESPVGSSASNGDVENAVQAMEKGIRRLRTGFENRYKIKLSLDSDIIPWLVIHAGFA